MASDPSVDPELEAAARSWAEHLRTGGTTPWADWVVAAPGPAVPRAAAPSPHLPGAAHLELLRRLNLEGPLPGLVDHVLTRPGPGRGRVHLPLSWPPERPAAPAAEVRRVAVGVLADLTSRLESRGVATGAEQPRGPASGRRRLRGRSFVLEGLPMTVTTLRAGLAAAGLVEHRPKRPWFRLGRRGSSRPDAVILVAGPLDQALREAWARRVLEGSPRSWRGFLTMWSTREALPPSAELDRVLQHWVPRVGPGQVHVVVTSVTEAAAPLVDRVAQILGVRPAQDAQDAGPAPLTPVMLDLLRRVNGVLPFLVPEEARAVRRDALADLMRTEPLGPRWVGLPRGRRSWVVAAGARQVETVRDAGVTVHGDLAALARPSRRGRGVRAEDTVAAAIRMIHRVERRAVATDGGPVGGGTDT